MKSPALLSLKGKTPLPFPLLWLFLGTALLCYLLFGPILLDPNGYMFGTSGDALNIYYSSTYFIKYVPEGFLHTGFSYPYGNHLVYDDVNPLFSMLLRSFSQHVVDVSDYTIAIINLSILLGFFPCAYFIYRILRKSLLPAMYAILASLLITFMSPQIERFTGHLTLSYVFYVPMIWYFILQIFGQKRFAAWLIAWGISVTLFAFIHPYYFLIGAGFLVAYTLIYFLQHREKSKQARFRYLSILMVSMLPVILLKGWEFMTNTGALDFVKYPYGFLLFTSSFKQVFFPVHEPLYSFWDGIFGIKPHDWEMWLIWEGVAYVGFSGLVMLFFFTARVGILAFKKKWKRIGHPVLPDTLRTSIWATTLLLIWAMGYPFKLWPELLEWFSLIRPFRSQGRLTWPFYYVYMSLCVYWLYQGFRSIRIRSKTLLLPLAAFIGILLLAGTWLYEARIPLQERTQHMLGGSFSQNYPTWEADFDSVLQVHGYAASDFQAILSFPYYHFGSEKLVHTSRLFHSSRNSMALSINTGLPMINTYVARAPISRSLELVQLMSNPWIHKTWIDQLPNNKPLLLVYTDEAPGPEEARIISLAKPITDFQGMHLASLNPKSMQGETASIKQQFAHIKDSLFSQRGMLSDKPESPKLFVGYGDGPWEMGKQAHYTHGKKMVLYNDTLPATQGEVDMKVSFWVKVDKNSDYLPAIVCEQYDKDWEVNRVTMELKFSTDVQGEWVRGELPFFLQKPTNRIYLYTFSEVEHLYVDNVLFQLADENIYIESEAGDKLYWNNYVLE